MDTKKYSECANKFKVDRHKEIFVDENLVKINGQNYWLWIAYEPHINSCLSVHLSKERTIFIYYQFFKQIREKYGKKPIYTDGAQWYIDACKWLRLKTFFMEQNLRLLWKDSSSKQKIELNALMIISPVSKDGCNMQHVWNWLDICSISIYENR